jgi:hypothetical protein
MLTSGQAKARIEINLERQTITFKHKLRVEK